jgi:hypothetical protein
MMTREDVNSSSGVDWEEKSPGVFSCIPLATPCQPQGFFELAASAIIMFGGIKNGSVVVCRADESDRSYYILCVANGVISPDIHPCSGFSPYFPSVVFGRALRSPSGVRAACLDIPSRKSAFFCPFSDNFGSLAKVCGYRVPELPVRMFPERFGGFDFISRPFDMGMNSDAEGSMARAVSMDFPSVNMCSAVIPDCGFWYGSVICKKFNPSEPRFIVDRAKLVDLFPDISEAEISASETVGVRIHNSEPFRKISGCTSPMVDIMTGGRIDSIWDFMAFYERFSGGKPFVPANRFELMELGSHIMVFVRDRVYRVPKDEAHSIWLQK